MISIYLLSFPNGKHYVGRTKNKFKQRLVEHKTRVTKKHQHPLYHACRKYGWNNVQKVVLETVETHEQAVLRELYYIEKYDSISNGYNLTINTQIGGDNWEGKRNTKEFEEFVNKMKVINSKLNNGMFGKFHKQESKVKMRKKAKGRFSLCWFKQKYGDIEGTQKYNERCDKLRNRNYKKLKDPVTGKFIKKK